MKSGILREVFTNSLNTHLMLCKEITWRTCYVWCSNFTVNATSFDFVFLNFVLTWLSEIKIFFSGGTALKVRKLDFHWRIVFISRLVDEKELNHQLDRVKGSGFFLDRQRRSLSQSLRTWTMKFLSIMICENTLRGVHIWSDLIIWCSCHVIWII